MPTPDKLTSWLPRGLDVYVITVQVCISWCNVTLMFYLTPTKTKNRIVYISHQQTHRCLVEGIGRILFNLFWVLGIRMLLQCIPVQKELPLLY